MKKLIAVCAATLTLGAFAAIDSYLYWMLGESTDLTWTGTAPESYNKAKIGYVDSSGNNAGYLSLYTIDGTQISSGYVTASSVGTGGLYAALDASASYSYYIELLNDNTIVGHSETFNYAALETYITKTIGGTSVPANVWQPTQFTTGAVPEPTSGLLMLFGLAGLALRRKRPTKA